MKKSDDEPEMHEVVDVDYIGIAAFLLLIGYSIDSDILLTTKVLKRRMGTLFERVKSAMKTG